MATNKETKNYFGGIPTDLDIKAIRDTFPDKDLHIGRIIGYSEVENIIGVRYKTLRFSSVTSRWRKLVEKDSGIIIGTERGQGFKVLNNSEKVELASQKQRSAVKADKRTLQVLAKVDRKEISTEEQGRFDLMSTRSTNRLLIAQLKTKVDLPEVKEQQILTNSIRKSA